MSICRFKPWTSGCIDLDCMKFPLFQYCFLAILTNSIVLVVLLMTVLTYFVWRVLMNILIFSRLICINNNSMYRLVLHEICLLHLFPV